MRLLIARFRCLQQFLLNMRNHCLARARLDFVVVCFVFVAALAKKHYYTVYKFCERASQILRSMLNLCLEHA